MKLMPKQKNGRICNQIITGDKKGFTNKEFKDVVNIGIGSSDLVQQW
jgi:glucose-6-phosphate isomerase